MSNKFNKYLVLTLFFITRYVYASNKSIDDIKAISGGIAYNPDDNTIYFKQDEGISSDFSNTNVQTYKIQSKNIINIITSRKILNHGKLSSEDSVYINQITGGQKEGAGISINKPTVFYGGDLNDNGYKASTELTFSKGLMAFNMNFTAADKNVFIVEQGFTSSNNEILHVFGIFNIGADSDANVANFIFADSGLITIENNTLLFSEKNLLKNAFTSKNGGIILSNSEGALISNNDKFTESYAKTTDTGGNITVNKRKITINDVSTGQAFFNANNGNINIDTHRYSRIDSITISTTDGTKKIAGFAKTNQNISLTTGNMTVDVTAIDDSANMFFADGNITATIDKLTFKTHDGNDANLAKSVFKGNDVVVTLDSLTFGEKVSFGTDAYLIEATGNAELKIIGNDFNWEVSNGIAEKLVTANGAATITIDQLHLSGMDGSSDQFNGFNFKENVTGIINLIIGEIYTDNDTKIVGLVSRDNDYDLNVLVNNDITLNGSNTSIGYLALSKNNGPATFFNLGSNDKSIKLSGGTVIDGFLVNSSGGNANLLDSTGGLDINVAKFKEDIIILVAIKAANTTATLGNNNADITIESLSVSDDTHTITSLIGLSGDNGGRTAKINSKKFSLTKSKFGAIVIDEGRSVDGAGIEITSAENLEISSNEFLQSFIVAPKQSITIAGGDNEETNISGNTISTALKTQ